MEVLVTLTGRTPLVMHNIRLRDERDPIKRQIAAITAKRKKTDADYDDIDRLEWHGGIYHDPGMGIYVPAWNVVKCFQRAAVVTREGTALLRAFAVDTDKLALQHDGPADPEALYERPEYRWRTAVGQGKQRVMRMRPIFRTWKVTLSGTLLEDLLGPESLRAIVDMAGRIEGLGDGRLLGYGRYTAEVAW